MSSLDIPHTSEAGLCIHAGALALRGIAESLVLPYNPDPQPGQPISLTRAEFDEALARLAAEGIPLKADRERAWRDFTGWRVNYDYTLLALAQALMAPTAPWTADRPPTPFGAKPARTAAARRRPSPLA
jgi:hypothetical protein